MDIIFKCKVEKNVAERFKLALMLNKEDPGDVIETFMLQYLSQITPKDHIDIENTEDYQGQDLEYSVKILMAFFQLERELGYVTVKLLEERCSDKTSHPETYVKYFTREFEKMLDAEAKPHGKLFDVADEKVVIWDCVKATLMSYKEYFER